MESFEFATQGSYSRILDERARFICCYCEGRIAVDDSHVEHFYPKEEYSNLQLDYGNLLCSCLRERSSGEPVHCGHRKGSWFDERALISPLQQDCETRFSFTANGEIVPRSISDKAAATTIDRLALDLPKLNALREAAIDALQDLPVSDVKRVLVQGLDGTFAEYFTTIKDVLL
ncbi:MAG: TIGR02646 family protein [Spirochaetaceae bacterium]|nr:TIGR02646 family protein [Spirochaetaceae bacterium]